MTKDEYQELYYKYQDMCDNELDSNLKDLYSKRYMDGNIDVFTEHRIASRVRLERNRTGESLMFHMKEFQIKK
tara:strand:+ start:962 stop:1180 length:219 start_codon:yes stop_codon:yes gene_type:complete